MAKEKKGQTEVVGTEEVKPLPMHTYIALSRIAYTDGKIFEAGEEIPNMLDKDAELIPHIVKLKE